MEAAEGREKWQASDGEDEEEGEVQVSMISERDLDHSTLVHSMLHADLVPLDFRLLGLSFPMRAA